MSKATCGEVTTLCVCELPSRWEHSIHECACGGQWEMREGRLVPWTMPGGPEGVVHKLALLKGWKPGT